VRNRRRARVAVTGMMAVLAVTSLGCGFVRDLVPKSNADPREASEDQPTYDSNAMGEVVGTNCRYDRDSRQFKYDISVQNASSEHTFTYNILINFTGGDTPFSDDSFGGQSLQVTVAAGRDRKLTVTQGYTMTKRTYYNCTITSATKSLAD